MSSQLPLTDLPEGTVTFLFTDIEGSTELLRQLRDQYATLLADQREILRAAFDKWDGREVDTQGDAFFVAFMRATDAMNAVVEIQRALAAHQWPDGVEVRVRMGLHTGEPWVGDEGYVGMDVHRAARIAHVGHGGQVLLSETTASLVRDELPDEVRLQDLGRHRLKDMKGPEHIRQLVVEGLLSEFPPLKSLEALPPEFPLEPGPVRLPDFLEAEEEITPRPIFVGRDNELASLNGFLDETLEGKGGVIFVTGSPGRGKTALMQSFAREALEKHTDILIAGGECSAFTGAADPYLPFKHILSMLTGDLEARWSRGTLSRTQALRLWEIMPMMIQRLMAEGPDLIDVLVPCSGLVERSRSAMEGGATWIERLAKLCESERALPGEFEQANLFEQYEAILRSAAQERPLLLLLDDLQWVDSASINLLFHLGRHLPGQRIMIVGAYRPEEVALGRRGEPHPLEKVLAEFKRLYGDVWIDLSKIHETEARAFVDAFVDSEPNQLTESFRGALYKHTGGHPLFTIELLRNMQERGDLTQDGEGFWVEGPDLEWGVLPARVEGVIEERIGRLREDLRETLTIASVEGEDFTAQVVGQIQEVSERRILRRLSHELEKQHRLVKVQEETKVGEHILSHYQFVHSLFQQFLYNDLSEGERRVLHGEVAEVLEQLYAGQTEEIAVQLAHHYIEAEKSDQAIQYWLLAGDQARASYAYEEAVDSYECALAILKDLEDYDRSARTLMKLGLTHHSAFAFDAARRAHDEGFTMWQRAWEKEPAVLLSPASDSLCISQREPRTLDPSLVYDPNSHNIIAQLFSGLLLWGFENEVVPDVAQTWEVSEDGSKYIFHLRDDVVWSDGVPVTAGDFEFALKRVLDPSMDSLASEALYDIIGAKAFHQGEVSDPDSLGVRATDDLTLVIELEAPTAYFLHLISLFLPVPSHVVKRCGAAWTEPGNIVTNGSFKLESWQPGETMSFSHNLQYHGHFTGNLQKVEVSLHESHSHGMLERYEAEELDVINIAPEQIDRARLRHGDEYSSMPHLQTDYISFDVSRQPFDDLRVRRAFVHAMDRDKLASDVMKGYVSPANGGLVPPGIPGRSEGIGLPYDPEVSRELLAEAGYPGGQGFPVVSFVSCLPYETNDYLQFQWEEILGVEISESVAVGAEFYKLLKESAFHIYGNGWFLDYFDPDNFLRVCIANGLSSGDIHWQNDEFERLIEEAKMDMDQGRRMKRYREADRILVEEAGIVPILHRKRHLLAKPWVRKFPVSPGWGDYWKDVVLEPH